jgi:hypothetical protein
VQTTCDFAWDRYTRWIASFLYGRNYIDLYDPAGMALRYQYEMGAMLHITNGESVIHSFGASSITGSYLSWMDVLHDGPVPYTSTLEALSDLRAHALQKFGWGTYDEIRSAFAARDRTLLDFHRYGEVVLWFEHDLFDQLQLLQLLDWFSAEDLAHGRLSLIQINGYPGIHPFHGLGQLTGDQLAELFPTRKTVTAQQFALARELWHAFRAPDPAALVELTYRDFPDLPFVRAALRRFLEEYPSATDGLSRSQRQILRAAASGNRRKHEIYKASQALEKCPWGDASVAWRMDALASGPSPALDRTGDQYSINEHGRKLLEGRADWIRSRGRIDTWLGGVNLTGTNSRWRWDPVDKTVIDHLAN